MNTGINQFAPRREQYAHRGGSHLFSYLCRPEQDLNHSGLDHQHLFVGVAEQRLLTISNCSLRCQSCLSAFLRLGALPVPSGTSHRLANISEAHFVCLLRLVL